jgi:hypothetical protein
MTVTINLPRNVEQSYLIAAQVKGVSTGTLLTDVLLSHAPVTEAGQPSPVADPQVIQSHGVTVLRTGHPLLASVVNETLESIRRERDFGVLGSF